MKELQSHIFGYQCFLVTIVGRRSVTSRLIISTGSPLFWVYEDRPVISYVSYVSHESSFFSHSLTFSATSCGIPYLSVFERIFFFNFKALYSSKYGL